MRDQATTSTPTGHMRAPERLLPRRTQGSRYAPFTLQLKGRRDRSPSALTFCYMPQPLRRIVSTSRVTFTARLATAMIFTMADLPRDAEPCASSTS